MDTTTSLDAAFALLNDARAQSFALQLRLRNALPALVLQRATRSSFAADENALQGSDWQHRRQLAWDVAQRIARIDRELASLPPAQRFWHRRQRRREQLLGKAEGTSSRANPKRSENVPQQPQADKRPARRQAQASIGNTEDEVTGTAALKLQTRSGHSNWKTNYVQRPERRRKEVQSDADNPHVLKLPTERVTLRARKEPSKAGSSRDKAAPTKPQKATVIDTPTKSALAATETPTSTGATAKQFEVKSAAEHELESFTPAREEKENRPPPSTSASANAHLEHDSQGDDDDVSQHKRETKPEAARSEFSQQLSSVGRQVLSEYRNAPSMALYGPPAVSGSTNTREHRLNSDVLRRLFNDLDTNRDGHLNRIETCMALHRLQISVPAPKIAAFFRRVSAHPEARTTAKRNSYRGNLRHADQHFPLMEVINYKQFVAFVTAAYDQKREQQQKQQQQQQQQIMSVSAASNESRVHRHQNARSSVGGKQHNDDKGIPLPLPERMPRSSTPNEQDTKKTPPKKLDTSTSGPDTLLYELETLPEDQLEQSVLKTLPDYLMSRLLENAETPKSRDEDENDNLTNSIVRRSLEKLLPRDSVDAQLVQEIAHDLMREHLRQRSLSSSDAEADEKDWSGLRRAAAYFEAQSNATTAEVDESQVKVDASLDDLDSWLGLLTEEQVSALIRELLNEKYTSIPSSSVANADEVDNVDASEPLETEPPRVTSEPDAIPPRTIDQETDMDGFLSSYVQMVAEKEVQAGENAADALPSPRDPDPPASAAVSSWASSQADSALVPGMTTRANLTRAVLSANGFSRPPDSQAVKSVANVTRTSVLQKLRAERKRYQPPARRTYTVGNGSMNSHPQALPLQDNDQDMRPSNRHEDMDIHSVASDDSQHSRGGDKKRATSGDGDLEEVATPHGTELATVQLFAEEPSEVSRSRSSSAASSHSSQSPFSDREITSRSAVRKMNRSSARAASRVQRYVQQATTSSEASSFRDSLVSEDLSEGEMEAQGDPADLSDGELFGKECARVAKAKNASLLGRIARGSDSGDDDIKSSTESGELLPIIKLRSTFHQRALDASCSSVESGELEEGRVE